MIFTYFRPASPDPSLPLPKYVAEHCKQTTPTSVHDLDLLGMFDWVTEHTAPGRKGDAGYIVAGDCRGTRSEDAIGPVSFALIDLDDAEPDWAQLEEYAGFAWTTASHTAEESHWRVVIPFKEPIAHGSLWSPFKGGHIRNRSQPALLPTGSPEWRALGGTKTLEPVEKPKAEHKPRATGSVQISELDARIATELASVWKHGCTGDQAFGALGGWARSRGVSDSRIANVAARVAELTESTHPDPEGRATQEDCTLGRKRLQERLSIDADLGAVALTLDDVETLLAASVPGFEPPKPKASGLRVLSGADLRVELTPTRWLCRDLQLCPGRPPVIAAAENAGKSWSLQCMAMSVALDLPIFGQFAIQTPGSVLHVCTDAGERATIRKYQQIARAMGRDIPDNLAVIPDRIVGCVDKWGAFVPGGLAELARIAEAGDYKLVILDSMFAICAGIDMNSPEAGNPLYRTKDDSRVWLWAMHIPKSGGSYFGSAAIGAAAGCMWGMSKSEVKESNRVWEIKKKSEDYDGAGISTFETTWQTERDNDGNLTAGQIVYVETAHEPMTREETRQECEQRIRTDIVAFLMAEDGGLGASAKRVEASVRGKGDTIRNVLKTLAYEGVLEHTGQRYVIKSRRGVGTRPRPLVPKP